MNIIGIANFLFVLVLALLLNIEFHWFLFVLVLALVLNIEFQWSVDLKWLLLNFL